MLIASAIAMQTLVYSVSLYFLASTNPELLAWLMILSGVAVGVAFGFWVGITSDDRRSIYRILFWGLLYGVGSGLACNFECVAMGHCSSSFEVFGAGSRDPWLYIIVVTLAFSLGARSVNRDVSSNRIVQESSDADMTMYEERSLRLSAIGVSAAVASAIASIIGILVSQGP